MSRRRLLKSLFFIGPLFAGLLFALLPVGVEAALADMRVCNQTGNPVSVALGYKAERGWESEGWWVAAPNDCATVFQGDLNGRYYYLFAADDISGGTWDGPVFMCTQDPPFTVVGVEDCLARGYERTGFFEVDTGERKNWTMQLTAANASTAPQQDVAPGTENIGTE